VKEKYRWIADKLIEDSYPVLRGKKIHIFVFKFKFYAMSVWIPPSFRFIVMSTRAEGFNDNVLTGILAHELCHQERYYNLGIGKYLLFAIKFLTSRKAQAEEETATDRLTIEKGYGKELYELTEVSHYDKNHEEIIELYMSPEEIKEYAIRIGKW
jgi:hypothetical protein